MINRTNIYKFIKFFTNHRKKTNRVVFLVKDPSLTFLNAKIIGGTYRQSGKTVEAHTGSGPLEEYNQDQTLLTNQGWL